MCKFGENYLGGGAGILGHSPHVMAALPPKLFPELTQVSLLAGYRKTQEQKLNITCRRCLVVSECLA